MPSPPRTPSARTPPPPSKRSTPVQPVATPPLVPVRPGHASQSVSSKQQQLSNPGSRGRSVTPATTTRRAGSPSSTTSKIPEGGVRSSNTNPDTTTAQGPLPVSSAALGKRPRVRSPPSNAASPGNSAASTPVAVSSTGSKKVKKQGICRPCGRRNVPFADVTQADKDRQIPEAICQLCLTDARKHSLHYCSRSAHFVEQGELKKKRQKANKRIKGRENDRIVTAADPLGTCFNCREVKATNRANARAGVSGR